MRVIEFYGMMRSGNHAVVQWLINNFFEDRIELENYKSHKTYKVKGKDTEELLYMNDYYFDNKCNDINLLRGLIEHEPNILIVSYENEFIKDSIFNMNGYDVEKVVLLRSFRNYWASYCNYEKRKGKNRNKEWLNRQFNWWLNHAEYVKESFDKKGTIFYDEWVRNPEYRKKIAELNDLPLLSDETGFNTNEHSEWGNGSSFTDSPTSTIDVDKLLNRYKEYDFRDVEREFIDKIQKEHPELIKFI